MVEPSALSPAENQSQLPHRGSARRPARGSTDVTYRRARDRSRPPTAKRRIRRLQLGEKLRRSVGHIGMPAIGVERAHRGKMADMEEPGGRWRRKLGSHEGVHSCIRICCVDSDFSKRISRMRGILPAQRRRQSICTDVVDRSSRSSPRNSGANRSRCASVTPGAKSWPCRTHEWPPSGPST